MTAAVATAAESTNRGRGALLRSNSIASALRALSTSLTSVLLPIILVVALPGTTYPVWALVSSIAAFTLYFDLGAQAAVLALVGKADASGDDAAAVSAGRAGIRVAASVGVIATLVGAGLGTVLAALFPAIPADLLLPAAATLVLLFAGQGLSLVGTALASYFGGRQRTASATAVLVPARFASLASTCIAAFAGADLVVLGIAFTVPLAVGVAVLGLRFAREGRGPASLAATVNVRALLRFSKTLILWNLCMLVVAGIDLTVVGRVDFAHVATYSIASTVAVGIAGLDNAMIAPLLPELSGRIGQGMAREATDLLRSATRLNAIALGGVFVVVVGIAPILSSLLLHSSEQALSIAIIVILAASNCWHLIVAPLSLGFIARGTHGRLVAQPVVEALVNLSASIGLGLMFGAIGVAFGTMVGTAVGVAAAMTWSLRVAGAGLIGRSDLLRQAVLWPLLAWAPAYVVIALVWLLGDGTSVIGIVVSLLGVVASIPLAIASLGQQGRAPVQRLLRTRIRRAAL